MTSFEDFDLDLARTDIVVAPADYNGNIGSVATATSATFIDKSNYYVLSADGQSISLSATLAYRIDYAMEFPEATIAITKTDLEKAKIQINRAFEWYTIMRLLSACDPDFAPGHARTDVHAYTSVSKTANWTNCVITANILYTAYLDDPIKAAVLCPDTHMAVILLIVNAIHRKTVSNHNWLSNKVSAFGSATAKAISAAGEYADDLIKYAKVEKTGHDMFHVLDTETIDKAADILTADIMIPKDVDIGGFNTLNGAVSITEVFGVPTGCVDRWPVSKPGVSAIFLACAEIHTTCASIAVATTNYPTAAVENMLKEITKFANHDATDRDSMVAIKEGIGSIAGFAVGYNSVDKEGKERIDSKVSLKRLVDKHIALRESGKKLGEYFSGYELDKATALSIAKEFTKAICAFADVAQKMAVEATAANKDELTSAYNTLNGIDDKTFDMKRLAKETREIAENRLTNISTMEKINKVETTLKDVDNMNN